MKEAVSLQISMRKFYIRKDFVIGTYILVLVMVGASVVVSKLRNHAGIDWETYTDIDYEFENQISHPMVPIDSRICSRFKHAPSFCCTTGSLFLIEDHINNDLSRRVLSTFRFL